MLWTDGTKKRLNWTNSTEWMIWDLTVSTCSELHLLYFAALLYLMYFNIWRRWRGEERWKRRGSEGDGETGNVERSLRDETFINDMR